MIVSAKGRKKRNVMTFDLGAENTGRFTSVMVESLLKKKRGYIPFAHYKPASLFWQLIFSISLRLANILNLRFPCYTRLALHTFKLQFCIEKKEFKDFSPMKLNKYRDVIFIVFVKKETSDRRT